MRRFALEFHDAASALWGPPYIDHLTYRSEDDIEDVSHWVVSQGKDMYTAVCAHPEIIATYENTAHRNMPALAFVADGIVADRLGDDWDLYAEYQDFADSGYATVSDYWEAQKTHRQ